MRLKFSSKMIMLLIILFPINVLASIESKIIATVGENIITSYDLKNKILSSIILSNKEVNQKNINEIKKQSLDYLIDYKLKKNEISKYDSSDMSRKFYGYLVDISNNNIENFKKNFKENNLDFDSFEDQIITEFKWRELIFRKFNKRININKDDVDNEIKYIIKNKKKIVEFKLSEIEILVDSAELIEIEIDSLKKKINEIGFENAAKAYSVSTSAQNGGNLGWVNKDAVSKKILKYIENINVGEISDFIIDDNKATIIKLVDKKVSETKNLNIEKIKADLIERKKNEMFGLYSSSFLSKLKNSTLIEYK